MTCLSLKVRLKLRAALLMSFIRRKLGLARAYTLKEGESVSQALRELKPGDTLLLPEGEYKEAING